MNARWYRVCAAYSALVWLNLLFLIGSLGIVTMPAALVALYGQARRMVVTGISPTWRGFFVSMRKDGIRGTAVLLVWALPVMGAGAVVGTSPSPFVAGVALLLGAVAATFLGLAPYVVTLGRDDVRGCIVRVVAAVVLRPGAAASVLLCWAGCATAVALLPIGVAVALYLVAVSLPTYLSCLIAAREPQTPGATPRLRAAAVVLAGADASTPDRELVS